MNTFKLSKPILIDGVETSEINYTLDELTGADMQRAIAELQKRKIGVSVAELDTNYQAMIFSIATSISFDDLSRMSIKDYADMTKEVRTFFLTSSAE